VILIAARSTSSRFPMKHLAPLNGSTVLDVLISRVNSVLPFAFLIPTGDPLKAALRERNAMYFEGPEEDVLKRHMLAMDRFNLSWCIRVTGDCPLISPQDLLWMAQVCTSTGMDYGTNCAFAATDGMEIEFISRRLMEHMHNTADNAHDREHVTPIAQRMLRDPKEARFKFYLAPAQYAWQGAGKLSIDTLEDLARVEALMQSVDKQAKEAK
jgi:spore coat polysaccharide biosynthesis protein SpsF (cytidylyltransferase family)